VRALPSEGGKEVCLTPPFLWPPSLTPTPPLHTAGIGGTAPPLPLCAQAGVARGKARPPPQHVPPQLPPPRPGTLPPHVHTRGVQAGQGRTRMGECTHERKGVAQGKGSGGCMCTQRAGGCRAGVTFRLGLVVFRERSIQTTIGTVFVHTSYFPPTLVASFASLLSCVVSCDVSVMCCVALFCVVPRPSDTSIVVLGFMTRSTVREELQSRLRYVYILRT
jgi:hypothetical protein